MILCHGSNQYIDSIDLAKSRPNKDFGQGFYLSADKEQALRMGEQKARQSGGVPVLNTYMFDESILDGSDLNIKIFKSYSEEWARFIISNRVGLQLFRYMKQYIDLPILVNNLKYTRVTIQYYFGTERAIKLLKKI